ncbi:DUF3159 domain-containing protein [Nesterenkonia populi]|uniref:DUF3159 domain-containing protein n=1 Tax=Nesterenkonia populi TaxID=1591087 RepID=UPI0011BE2E71|nr:DUF3159 domain-containing protein [Nesterenkonia populi]
MTDHDQPRQLQVPAEDRSRADEVGEQLSAQAGAKLHARDDGSLDVWTSIGGWRGLAEATLPPAAFLIVFILTEELGPALISSLVVAGMFAAVRLIQRGTLVQAVSGMVGVGLCALVAQQTGEARDFYILGMLVNALYITAFIISIGVKWPVVGLLFGFIRGQGVAWRQHDVLRRRYALATWILVCIMSLRLLVQVPLYFADTFGPLGTARLVMGVPLWALGLWIGWMITRPQVTGEAAEAQPDEGARPEPARD